MAGSLKEVLEKHFEEELTAIRKITVDTQNAASQLSGLDIDNADYIVNIVSLWEGERRIKYSYHGNLRDAVRSAEKKFMSANHRTNVDASYYVDIKVGNVKVEVPQKYWGKYKKRD